MYYRKKPDLSFKRRTKKVKQMTAEQKKWVADYRKNDRKIYQSKLDLNKELRVCRTTRLKGDVIRMAKKQEDDKIGNEIYRDKILKNIGSIKNEVTKFSQKLTNFDKNDEFLSKIETYAEEIQLKITNFKQVHIPKFEDIQDQIENLEDDLDALGGHIDQWISEPKQNILKKLKSGSHANRLPDASGSGSRLRRGSSHTPGGNLGNYIEELYHQKTKLGIKYRATVDKRSSVKTRLKEIEDRIERNGGINCGWPSDDHSEFVKISFRMKGRLDSIPFMDEIKMQLPLLSEPQIAEHVLNYKTFMNLDNQKKELMMEYKELTKEVTRLEGTHRSLLVSKTQKQPSKRTLDKLKKEREAQKEKIRKWRQEKEVNRIVKEEQEEDLKKFERDKQFLKRRKQLEKKRMLVNEYKQMKEIKRARDQEVQEMKNRERKYISVEQKRRIKQKENKLIEKRKRLMSAQREKKNARAKRLEELKGIVPPKFGNVKSRLRNETYVSIGRQREKFAGIGKIGEGRYANNMAGMLVRTTGRAMAGWKGGI